MKVKHSSTVERHFIGQKNMNPKTATYMRIDEGEFKKLAQMNNIDVGEGNKRVNSANSSAHS